MEYTNSKMFRIYTIGFFFIQNGRVFPKSMNFIGGHIVDNPRNILAYWIIGKFDLYEVRGDETRIAERDEDVVAMIESFA